MKCYFIDNRHPRETIQYKEIYLWYLKDWRKGQNFNKNHYLIHSKTKQRILEETWLLGETREKNPESVPDFFFILFEHIYNDEKYDYNNFWKILFYLVSLNNWIFSSPC